MTVGVVFLTFVYEYIGIMSYINLFAIPTDYSKEVILEGYDWKIPLHVMLLLSCAKLQHFVNIYCQLGKF